MTGTRNLKPLRAAGIARSLLLTGSLFLGCVWLSAGCAALRAPAAAPLAAGTPTTAEAQALTNQVLARARRLDGLQTSAVMNYRGGGQQVKAREEITLRQPDSLRVEALSPFGVALVVTAHQGRMAIYDPSNTTFYTGAANAQTLQRFAQIPLAPWRALRLLMGLLPDDPQFFAQPQIARIDRGMVVGVYQLPDGRRDELGYGDGQLLMVRTLAPDGTTDYDVRYADYQDIGGLMFPHHLEVDFSSGTHLDFRYSHAIVNPKLNDEQFVLAPQGPVHQIDLDRSAPVDDQHN